MKKKNKNSKAIRFLIFALFFFMVCASSFAQQITVSGNVVDSQGESLPGVTVFIKGTTQGTITDINGNYSIPEVDKESVIVFSFIGMSTQEILIGNQTVINVTMKMDAIGLDEVVAVGYGTQKKQTLTGSVEQVKSEVFEKSGQSNPVMALQGQSPGLVITRTSARPGDEDIDLTIRGTNSINAESPLIIIDGIATMGQSAFTSLNPDDIESISILKDGAAAIYGARASNGVILVTTKKGSGDIKINVSSVFKVNTVSMKVPLCESPQEYAEMWLSYGEQDQLAGLNTSYWAWTQDQLEWMRDVGSGYLSTIYWDDFYVGDNSTYDDFYGTSYSQQHNVSISGGDEKSNYRVSLGFVEDVGPVKPVYDGKKQYNLRSNYNFKVNNWFDIETSTSYFNRKLDGPEYDGFRAMNELPLFPAYDQYGNWGANFGVKSGATNRLAELVDGGRSTSTREELRLKLSAILKLMPDLTFRTDVAVDRAWVRSQAYQNEIITYAWDGTQANSSINSNQNWIEESSNDTKHMTYQGFFNYNKQLNDHSFKLMAGGTAEKRTYDKTYAKLYGFEDFGVYDLNMGSTDDNFTISGGGNNWGIMSLLGRFNYSYRSKYMVEIQGRRDGSSRFAEGYKWSNFGGGSVGWVISEEGFLSDVDFLSFLKLRLSYGELGNQGGIGEHDYASLVDRTGTVFFGQQDVSEFTTATVNDITTNDRSWETIKTTNVGADFSFFNGKLNGTVDYFHMLNEDMLISITYPDLLGGSPKTTNSGKLKTNGWEFQIGWRDRIGELSYNIGFNMSDSKNELVEMEGANSISEGKVKYLEGYALNTYFLYKTDGFFATQEEAEAYYQEYSSVSVGNLPTSPSTLRAGDTRVVDVDGNGYIHGTGDGVEDTGDLVDCGDAAVHYSYGISLGLEWKNWDFGTFLQGVLKHNIYRGDGQVTYPRSGSFTNQNTAYNGLTWSPDNTNAEYPRLSTYGDIATWNYQYKDFMLASGRYLRCKTLTLGYTFDDIKIKDKKIDNLRVYFTGNDLFTFTPMLEGWDPEYGSSTDSTYPFYKTWSFGLNLTF